MAGRQWHRRSAAEKARTLAAWQASGLSGEAFAARNEVSLDSLYRWRREATGNGRRRRRPASPGPLIPVHVRPSPSAAAIEIDWGDGRRIRCAVDVPPATVAALIAALARSAC